MKRYAMAYVLWLIFLGALMGFLLEWYRRKEEIGWGEVIARLRAPLDAPVDADSNGGE